MLNELEHTILGLIAMRPGATGYEIKQVIQDSTAYMMHASFSQIYPALGKLHKLELVEFELQPIKNRPGKKSYRLTAAGMDELQRWLRSPIDFKNNTDAFDLRLVFGFLMPKDDLLYLLDSAIRYLDGIVSGYARVADGRDPESYAFLDNDSHNMHNVDLIWRSVGERYHEDTARRLEWLKKFREKVAAEFEKVAAEFEE